MGWMIVVKQLRLLIMSVVCPSQARHLEDDQTVKQIISFMTDLANVRRVGICDALPQGSVDDMLCCNPCLEGGLDMQ